MRQGVGGRRRPQGVYAEAVNVSIDANLLAVASPLVLPTVLQFLANKNLPISTDFLHNSII